MRSVAVPRGRRRSRRRPVLTALCLGGAALAAVLGGVGKADWAFDSAVPQPPAEASISTVESDPPRLLSPADARRSVLDRARRLSAIAHAPSEQPPHERPAIPDLPPAAAALRPPPPQTAGGAAGEVPQ